MEEAVLGIDDMAAALEALRARQKELLGEEDAHLADALLGVFWDQWKIWRIVLLAVVGFVVLLLLYRRILDKLPLPERRKKKVELVVE